MSQLLTAKFLPRASVRFFFLSSWNIMCIFWYALWTQLYNIFNKKLGLIFKFKEAMQWPVTELLIATVSVVGVWSLWQSANTQVCVQVYHHSKPNLDLRGYKFNWTKLNKTKNLNQIKSCPTCRKRKICCNYSRQQKFRVFYK